MFDTQHIFYCFCHQIAERSPQFEGEIFPVCFRCAGIYLGIFASYSNYFLSKKIISLPHSLKEIILLSLLMLPILIDGMGNFFSIWHSDPIIRSITGLFAGIFLSIILIPFFKLTGPGKNKSNVHTDFKKLFIISTTGMVLILLLYFPYSIYVFNILAYLMAVGLILIAINIFILWKYYRPFSTDYEVYLINGDENG